MLPLLALITALARGLLALVGVGHHRCPRPYDAKSRPTGSRTRRDWHASWTNRSRYRGQRHRRQETVPGMSQMHLTIRYIGSFRSRIGYTLAPHLRHMALHRLLRLHHSPAAGGDRRTSPPAPGGRLHPTFVAVDDPDADRRLRRLPRSVPATLSAKNGPRSTTPGDTFQFKTVADSPVQRALLASQAAVNCRPRPEPPTPARYHAAALELANFHVSPHPLVAHKLRLLRDAATEPKKFRELTRELATMLAYEATADLQLAPAPVTTPLATVDARELAERVGLVPILRAGLGMVEGVWEVLPMAEVWHIGLYRDEATLRPVESRL